jgi:hypothetical protein
MARLSLLLVVVLVPGCGALALGEADCRAMDWYQRGYDDGYFGHPPQDLSLARQCAPHGVRVADSRYLEGWRLGHDEWDRLMGSIDFN